MNNKYTKEILQSVISSSISWGQVCKLLGCSSATGAQSHIKKRSIDFGIDFSHFLGQAHGRGKKSLFRKSALYYCTVDSKITSHNLRIKLLEEGIKDHICEKCGLKEWLGYPIPLELHHINGRKVGNIIENLMLLCPNCHALETNNPVVKLADAQDLNSCPSG